MWLRMCICFEGVFIFGANSFRYFFFISLVFSLFVIWCVFVLILFIFCYTWLFVELCLSDEYEYFVVCMQIFGCLCRLLKSYRVSRCICKRYRVCWPIQWLLCSFTIHILPANIHKYIIINEYFFLFFFVREYRATQSRPIISWMESHRKLVCCTYSTHNFMSHYAMELFYPFSRLLALIVSHLLTFHSVSWFFSFFLSFVYPSSFVSFILLFFYRFSVVFVFCIHKENVHRKTSLFSICLFLN